MAVYPVINKVTGEQKEIKMSVHDWDQWKKDILIGTEIGQTHQPFQTLERWERFMTN